MFGGLHSPRPLPSDHALLDLAREFTPRVEARGPTPVLLDLHGLGRVWPTAEDLGQALLRAACERRPTPHVALARTPAPAPLAARGPAGLPIIPPRPQAPTPAPL